MKAIFRAIICSLIPILGLSPSSAKAQDALFKLFGNLIKDAAVNHARRDWSRLPTDEKSCMETSFEQQGYSIDKLIDQGVRPNDPSIATIRDQCRTAPVQANQSASTVDVEHLSEKPTFDCSKAKSATGRILCQDSSGASADWNLISSSWAFRFSLPAPDRKSFDAAEDKWFHSLNGICRLDNMQGTFSTNQRLCVINAYKTRTNYYQSRIHGDALAESKLSPEDHARIQDALVSLGFLQGDVDGEFGESTRGAIRRYHQQYGLPEGDFLTYRDRAELLKKASSQSAKSNCTVADPTGTPLNIRSSPDGEVVSNLANGIGVRILGESRQSSGDWVQITLSSNNQTLGWAFRAYLNCEQESLQTAAPANPATATQSETPRLKQARDFLADARSFLAKQNTVPNMSAIAGEAQTLKLAIGAFDETAADESIGKLKQLLSPLSGFDEFEAAATQARLKSENQKLAQAKQLLSNNAHFLDSYMAKHLGDEQTSTLLQLRGGIDRAQRENVIDVIQKSNDEVARFISSQGLSEEYSDATSEPKKPQTLEERLAISDKSKFLIDGPKDDILLLYNVTSSAPRVWRNVHGDIVFEGNSASVCFAETIPDIHIVRYVEHILRDDGAKKLSDASRRCDLNTVAQSTDVIALVRRDLIDGDTAYGSQTAKLVNSDEFKKYKIIDDYLQRSQKLAALSHTIEAEVKSGGRQGYGVLSVGTSSAACVINSISSDKLDGLKQLIRENRDVIAPDLSSQWQFVMSSPDFALLSLQRKQCGYVSGDASDLKAIATALSRDGILKPTFVAVWWSDQDLDQAGRDYQDAQEQESRKKAVSERALEEQRSLEEERMRTQQAQKTEKEHELRELYGVTARGLLRDIDEMVRKQAEQRNTPILPDFGDYTSWLATRFASNWETFNVISDIADFGQVSWDKRSLNAIIVKSVIQQKNRLLGKYDDRCYLFGIIWDDEFSMPRDGFAVDCSDLSYLADWKSKESFSSKWNVN